MDRKGQVGMQVGSLILLAIALIVGAIFIQASAQNVGSATTLAAVNESISTVVNGTTQYLTDIKYLDSPVVYNATGPIVGAGNYTITNHVVHNGQETVSILPAADVSIQSAWRVTGTGQPLGYIGDVGGRSIASLIVLLMAVALIVVAAIWAIKAYGDFD